MIREHFWAIKSVKCLLTWNVNEPFGTESLMYRGPCCSILFSVIFFSYCLLIFPSLHSSEDLSLSLTVIINCFGIEIFDEVCLQSFRTLLILLCPKLYLNKF